ncbi:UDP-4-amino-4,6-dideoxy-N-acetyl-beta-L-altrosamine transaminase [Celeribacter sp.]|uniref:UDP-4-amino-4, 6-dideoxy-N-acetyl-beta-L-altrosamine transaminase n=1 Tax=Celeribacter sp. TaxID=1890673 RepID=UPI003A8DF8D8
MTNTFIPYGRQDITDEDVAAVVEVLQSDFLTQGPQVPAFEAAVAERVGAAHGVAMNSATSALHAACMALDLGQGDWLWTVPTTFVASANCGLYCGAQVDFVDIDPETYTMSVSALSAKLEAAQAAGTLPKVIVPVHLCGQSADMEAISRVARAYGVKIIEDASHSIGADHQELPVGDCRYSDITVFSFHPVKIITTCEGGLATTQDAGLARKMELARSHGITRETDELTHAPDGPWYYQQVTLGYNYRMTEIQAALGLSQLTRLDSFVARRRELAARYNQLLADLPVTLPAQHPDTNSSWHLYVIRVAADRHAAVFDALRAAGIGVNLHYIPVHTQPYYRAMGFAEGQFPNAEAYYAEAISIPLYAGLSDADQDRVVAELAKALAVTQ